jgi:hypothetical protein
MIPAFAAKDAELIPECGLSYLRQLKCTPINKVTRACVPAANKADVASEILSLSTTINFNLQTFYG